MLSEKAKDIALSRSKRTCLSCGYSGYMKTWLGHNSAPQLIALVLLLFYLVPGIIFIIWCSGKFKCPKCGTVGKSAEAMPERKCPYCAEIIQPEAVLCRYCKKDLPPAS